MPMGTPDNETPLIQSSHLTPLIQSSDLQNSTQNNPSPFQDNPSTFNPFTSSDSPQSYKFNPMTGERLQPETPTAPAHRFDPMTGRPLTPTLPDKANQTADVDKTPPDEPDENEFTHYVHLADGRVIKAMGGFTHFFESDKPDAVAVPVIGVYPAERLKENV